MTTPRWYMVNEMGMATLCSDKDGAEKEAADAQMAWPHMGPHRAVQLVEAADVEAMRAGYDAARLEIESLRAALATPQPAPASQGDALDAARYRWLRERMLGIDFDWNESGITALSFEMPDGCAYGGCCNQNIDAARAAQEGKSHGLKT